MMTDQELLADFNHNANDFFANTNLQRQEIYRAYEYRDCHQWNAKDLLERERMNKAITTINLAAPYVRAVAGSEIMKANQLEFVSMDEEFDADADVIDDGVEYAQYASNYHSERALARVDTATCGIGGTVTYLDMTHKNFIAGKPVVERIFPGFIGYDNSSRGSQINKKARWVFYADPVSVDSLNMYIEEKTEGKRNVPPTGAGDYKAYLMSFSQQQNQANIDFIYHYFWWEYADIYDVENPARGDYPEYAAILQDTDCANMIGELAAEIKIDWKAAYWSLDRESYKKLTDTLEACAALVNIEPIEIEYSKRKGKCYYRAEFARGMLLSRSRSYTQGVHALNLVTGYFDEVLGIYYGLLRPLSYVQDALNVSISDFLSYARSASHGGSVYIKGGEDAIKMVRDNKAYEDAVTPIPTTAEIISKPLPNTPQVLVEFIRLMMEVMPRTLGLGQEFLGVITSGDMTEALYGKIMKQSYAVLEDFANNSASADIDQGAIFVDLVRLMANANDGMILPVLSPNKKPETYIRLTKQNLAMEYAIRIVERPMTKDEKQSQANALIQLIPHFQQAGINILPVYAKLSTLEQELKDELIALSTPKPPAPDPMNQALLGSQAALQNAQAKKLEAEAMETMNTLALVNPEKRSIIDKNDAQTLKLTKEAMNVGHQPAA